VRLIIYVAGTRFRDLYEVHLNSNTVPLSSQDFEVEHAQNTGICSAKLDNDKFYVISGSRCISIDVSVTCDTDTLQMYQ